MSVCVHHCLTRVSLCFPVTDWHVHHAAFWFSLTLVHHYGPMARRISHLPFFIPVPVQTNTMKRSAFFTKTGFTETFLKMSESLFLLLFLKHTKSLFLCYHCVKISPIKMMYSLCRHISAPRESIRARHLVLIRRYFRSLS